jgi:hypothetical protein
MNVGQGSQSGLAHSSKTTTDFSLSLSLSPSLPLPLSLYIYVKNKKKFRTKITKVYEIYTLERNQRWDLQVVNYYVSVMNELYSLVSFMSA